MAAGFPVMSASALRSALRTASPYLFEDEDEDKEEDEDEQTQSDRIRDRIPPPLAVHRKSR
jgi:hypothetical protein